MAGEQDHPVSPSGRSLSGQSLSPLGAVLWVVALAGPGCSGSSTDEEEASTGSAIELQNKHNYSSTTNLTISTIETAPGDIEVCWSEVTSDIQCHEVAPVSDLDNVTLARVEGMSEDEAREKLETSGLQLSEIHAYFQYETNHEDTCVSISSMGLFGKEIDVEQDYVVNEDFTYALLVTHGTVPGVGTRTMTFLRPTDDSDVTTVQVPAGCDPDAPILDFSAELSAETGKVPREGPWVIDWKDVTRDGQGNELAYASIDRVLVGFYEGMTVRDIEDRILDIEILPTALWEAELSGGRRADLAETKNRDNGTSFGGFERDEEGVWLFGLTCSTCQNPAPLVLAVLEPSEG